MPPRVKDSTSCRGAERRLRSAHQFGDTLPVIGRSGARRFLPLHYDRQQYQYFPKGADLTGYDATHLDDVAAQLNARPRQTVGWLTPSEAFIRAVAMTGWTG